MQTDDCEQPRDPLELASTLPVLLFDPSGTLLIPKMKSQAFLGRTIPAPIELLFAMASCEGGAPERSLPVRRDQITIPRSTMSSCSSFVSSGLRGK